MVSIIPIWWHHKIVQDKNFRINSKRAFTTQSRQQRNVKFLSKITTLEICSLANRRVRQPVPYSVYRICIWYMANWSAQFEAEMKTIAGYVKGMVAVQNDDDRGPAYHQRRAARHQQEADRLYRLGDDRQAAMHASISRKHMSLANSTQDTQAPT